MMMDRRNTAVVGEHQESIGDGTNQFEFQYSLAKYNNECARNQLWKKRQLLKRLKQHQQSTSRVSLSDRNEMSPNRSNIKQDAPNETDITHFSVRNGGKTAATRGSIDYGSEMKMNLERNRVPSMPRNVSISTIISPRRQSSLLNRFSIVSTSGGRERENKRVCYNTAPATVSVGHTKVAQERFMQTNQYNKEMQSLQRNLKNLASEQQTLLVKRDSLRQNVLNLECEIDSIRSRWLFMKRSRSLPDVARLSMSCPQSPNRNAVSNRNRISSALPKRKLPSIAATLRVKIQLVALKKRAQQRIERRKQEEHIPFPELSRKTAAKFR